MAQRRPSPIRHEEIDAVVAVRHQIAVDVRRMRPEINPLPPVRKIQMDRLRQHPFRRHADDVQTAVRRLVNNPHHRLANRFEILREVAVAERVTLRAVVPPRIPQPPSAAVQMDGATRKRLHMRLIVAPNQNLPHRPLPRQFVGVRPFRIDMIVHHVVSYTIIKISGHPPSIRMDGHENPP